MAGKPVKSYQNPVINYSLPDPSIIKGEDGYYYLYATRRYSKPAYSSFERLGGVGICGYCFY